MGRIYMFLKSLRFSSIQKESLFPSNHLILLNISIEKGKVKTRKSANKRFKLTGSGKIVRRQCGTQHLNEKKSNGRKKSLSKYQIVSSSDMKNVAKCLPYMHR